MSGTVAIVLNYCREALTAQCVDALARSVPTPPRIMIVDNASPDGSGERLRQRFPEHGFLQTGANLGYAGGNARGIDRALEGGARFVLVINDDATVRPETVALLERALEADPRAGMAGPTIRFDDPHGSLCWAGGELDLVRGLGRMTGTATPATLRAASPGAQACSFVSGCCVLLRAEAVRAEGGFDPGYFSYGEDVELSLRLARAGWRLLWVPRAAAVHHSPYPEPPAPAWKIRYRDRNRRRMVRRHYDAGERLAFALWFWPTRVLHLVRYLVRGDWSRLREQWRGMLER